MLRSVTRALLVIAIATALVFAGHLLVLHRSGVQAGPGRSSWFGPSPDAIQYVAMADGKQANPPFSQRILVPFVASLLPMPADRALRTVSYISFALLYTVIILTLFKLGFSRLTIAAAVIMLFSSTAHLYLYSNPYLTDAFGCLCLSLMVYYLFVKNRWGFAASATLGVLARESTLFLAPSFAATGRWKSTFAVLIGCGAAYIIPRLLIPGSGYTQFSLPSQMYLVKVYLTWGILWLPMLLGLVLAPPKHSALLRPAFVLLLAGSLFSSLKATDTLRMYTFILPATAICWAYFVSVLWQRNRTLVWLILALCVCSIPLAVPTILMPGASTGMRELEDFYLNLKRSMAVMHAFGLILGFLAVIALWRDIKLASPFARFSKNNQFPVAQSME